MLFEGGCPSSQVKVLFDDYVCSMAEAEAAAMEQVYLFGEWDGDTTIHHQQQE